MNETTKTTLIRSRKFVELALYTAEAAHDDPESDSYMDLAQWEIMEEARSLLAAIDLLIG